MLRLQGLQSTTVEFDKVFVNGEPYYDAKDACRISDPELQLLVFDNGGSVKCGEVMVAQKGHYTFVCALCQMIFDSMPSFGLHVQVHTQLKSERSSELDEISDNAFNSLMSPELGTPPSDFFDIKMERTDELETMMNVTRDELSLHGSECGKQSAFQISETKTCKYWDKHFGEDDTLSEHAASHSDLRPLACDLYPKRFDHPIAVKDHVRKYDSSVDNAQIYVQDREKEDTDSPRASLAAESSAVHMPEAHICKYCDKSFINVETLSEHIATHKGPLRFECQYCSMKFTTRPRKLNHQATHTNIRPFKCLLCPSEYCYASALNRHMKQRHSKVKNKLIEVNEKVKLKESSENEQIDGASVNSNIIMTIEKTDEQIYEATTVSAALLPKVSAVLNPAHEIHPQNAYLTSQEEKNEATTNAKQPENSLAEQESSEHELIDGESSNSDLPISNEKIEEVTPNQPAKLSTALMPGSHICRYCDKQFNDARTLSEHIRTHKGRLKFECQYCPMKFTTRPRKLNHQATHTNIRPFKCLLCPCEYCYASALNRHMKQRHSKAKNKLIEVNEKVELKKSENEQIDGPSVNSNIIMTIEKTDEQSYEAEKVPATPLLRVSAVLTPALETHSQNPYLTTQEEKNEVTTNMKQPGNSLTEQESSEHEHIDEESTNSDLTISNKKIEEATSNQSAKSSSALMPGSHICRYCDKQFNDARTLSEHIRTHKGPLRFECQYCPMKFHTRTRRLNHQATHTNIRSFKCLLCPCEYCYASALKRHMKQRHSKGDKKAIGIQIHDSTADAHIDDTEFKDVSVGNTTEKELETYVSAELFSKHKPISAIKTCKFCDTRFENSKLLLKHIEVEHKGSLKYSCPHCAMKFAGKGIKTNHIAAAHNKPKNSNLFLCRLCPKIYSHKMTLRRHLKLSHFSMKGATHSICTNASKLDGESMGLDSAASENVNNSRRATTNEKEEERRSYTLAQLYALHNVLPAIKTASGQNGKDGGKPTDFLNDDHEKQLENTISTDGKRPEIDDKNLICPFCHFGCTSKLSVYSHIRENHSDRIELPEMFSEEDYAKFVTPNLQFAMCRYCEQKFYDMSEFRTHLKSHQGNLKYPCLYCPKRFAKRERQRMHMNIHTGQRPYKCSHCPKGFAHRTNLIKHVRAHLNIKKYECKFCGKRFVQNTAKKMHEKLHTGERDYQCEQCGNCFVSLSQLKLHMRRHLNHRNFQCDQCDKAFYTSYHLKRHNVVHTTERPYECDICHRTYPRIRTLRAHQQLHFTEKKYECNICGKRFHQYAGMYIHRRTHGERFQ